MFFNSLHFLLFFPCVVGLYFALPHRYRWAILLAASYYFYAAWKVEYLILIIASTGVDYWASLRMSAQAEKKNRKKYLYMSLLSNLGLLFVFKYYNFFVGSFNQVMENAGLALHGPALDVLLPVGISFYTFQTLSYTIDVYKGKIEPERHIGIFALFVSFFPQLVAGPIERASHLLPQLKKQYAFSYERTVNGLRYMLWGMFLKVVVADNLAPYVNAIYDDPTQYTGAPLLIATYFFAFQIFCDFAGYSYIAIGTAKVLGIDIMENFKRPYLATSIGDFWRRWHISLSQWFRDYVYIPLGGSRASTPRIMQHIMIVFVVSGLWHGANWTFVVWGMLHGWYMAIEIGMSKIVELAQTSKSACSRMLCALQTAKQSKLGKLVSIVVVFHLVLMAWVFFRANSVSDAMYILTHLAIAWDGSLLEGVRMAEYIFKYAIGLIVYLITAMLLKEKYGGYIQVYSKIPTFTRWGLYYAMLLLILFGSSPQSEQFMYFQF